MKRSLRLVSGWSVIAALAIAVLAVPGTTQAADTCPSPLPNCTTSGTLANFTGTFNCTGVQAKSSGVIGVELVVVTSNGAGTITNVTIAENKNDAAATPPTFEDFTSQSGFTYCLNTNNTGFIFQPAGSGDCPLALIVSPTNKEGRLISTANAKAQALVCRQQ